MSAIAPPHSFEFILSDRKFSVRDENELSLVFELLAKTATPDVFHWNVIMSLDEKLLSIIKTHTGLIRCLRHLSNKNRFLLFVKVGDILSSVIRSADVFARLVASMPESVDQEKFVKILRRKGLVSIIGTPSEMGKVLEWASASTDRFILEALGAEFVRSLIASSKDFYDILYFIKAQNKRFFCEIVGWEFFKERTFSADDFFYALKAVDVDDTDTYLRLFEPDWIRKAVINERGFHSFLMKLSFTKQDPLLRYLSYDPNEFNSVR